MIRGSHAADVEGLRFDIAGRATTLQVKLFEISTSEFFADFHAEFVVPSTAFSEDILLVKPVAAVKTSDPVTFDVHGEAAVAIDMAMGYDELFVSGVPVQMYGFCSLISTVAFATFCKNSSRFTANPSCALRLHELDRRATGQSILSVVSFDIVVRLSPVCCETPSFCTAASAVRVIVAAGLGFNKQAGFY